MSGYVDLSDASRRRGGSDPLRAYVARPLGVGPWPVVVLVHEAFGIDANMVRHAARIADWGYVVVAPDLYSEGGPRKCLVSTFRALMAGRGRAFVDIETARLWAGSLPETTDRVGLVGFCMGGGFALLTADRDRYDVLGVNYGQLPSAELERYERMCPVVASYGGADRSIRHGGRQLHSKLQAHDIENDVREYADAGHAFLNEEASGPRLLRPVSRIAHMGPDPVAAADAWRRIERFFADHLASQEPSTPVVGSAGEGL